MPSFVHTNQLKAWFYNELGLCEEFFRLTVLWHIPIRSLIAEDETESKILGMHQAVDTLAILFLNSPAPGRRGWNIELIILKFLSISCEIALMSMPQDLILY